MNFAEGSGFKTGQLILESSQGNNSTEQENGPTQTRSYDIPKHLLSVCGGTGGRVEFLPEAWRLDRAQHAGPVKPGL